jgi:putative adenylate-forming enzyme
VSVVSLLTAYVAARRRARALHGAALHEWREARVQALVATVRARSPFYAQHWAGCHDRDWATFPVVTKALMMEHFDRFTTRGLPRDRVMAVAVDAEVRRDFSATMQGLTVGLSTGTSGHRGLFVVSPAEQTQWAGTILARAIPELWPGLRVAFFLRANSRLYERTAGVVRFRFFDLLRPLPELLDGLNALQPQLIVGPPSLLGLLADARLHGTLHVTPRRLISVAEVLEPQDRARLESVFQAPVGEVYQCTEGLIAVTCRYDVLHVQEDVMALHPTVIDATDPQRVSPVITDVWRGTQPIVRYQLGDVLRLDATPCRCGSTWQRIAAIEGRQDDCCRFPCDDGSLRLLFPDAIRRMILLADSRITEYHVVQPGPGALHIALDVSAADLFPDVARLVRARVHSTLREYGCTVASLEISHGVPAPVPGAKRRRVINTGGAASAERAPQERS